MSFHVTSTCTQRKFGSATRKQIISFLADKASDDGSGIWCSKGTIAQNTELSKSTVKRTITQFLNEGIILETGKRSNSRGYTVEYRINLDQVAQLPLTKELPETTGVSNGMDIEMMEAEDYVWEEVVVEFTCPSCGKLSDGQAEIPTIDEEFPNAIST